MNVKAQDAAQIIKGSINKCKAIENGYLEYKKIFKPITSDETSEYNIKSYFKKLNKDTLSNLVFHNIIRDSANSGFDELYDGENFYNTYSGDTILEIIPKSKYTQEVKAYIDHSLFYTPILKDGADNYPNELDFIDSNKTFTFCGFENLNNQTCYKIKITIKPWIDQENGFEVKKAENLVWISKADSIPVRFKSTFEIIMNSETSTQIFDYALTKYSLNSIKNDRMFSKKSINNIVKEVEYTPYEEKPLLADGTEAPEWQLKSMFDKTVKNTDFKGKVVLLDFFYKGCGFCMKALPFIVKLYNTYQDKGFEVVGMNPYDTKESGIAQFLEKKGVKYQVMLDVSEVASKYKVSGYPTMYLIDKNGKIIDTIVGYDKSMEEEIENTIKKALEQK
jgi:peroxiredoxin